MAARKEAAQALVRKRSVLFGERTEKGAGGKGRGCRGAAGRT